MKNVLIRRNKIPLAELRSWLENCCATLYPEDWGHVLGTEGPIRREKTLASILWVQAWHEHQEYTGWPKSRGVTKIVIFLLIRIRFLKESYVQASNVTAKNLYEDSFLQKRFELDFLRLDSHYYFTQSTVWCRLLASTSEQAWQGWRRKLSKSAIFLSLNVSSVNKKTPKSVKLRSALSMDHSLFFMYLRKVDCGHSVFVLAPGTGV